MAIRDLFRRKQSPQSAPSRKTSATGPVVAYHSSGRVVWSARDTSSLTKTGYCGNPVGFRAVKLIAEAAAAVPLVLQDADTRYSDHPILRLIRSPNAAQTQADFLEALYGQLILTGNAYVICDMVAWGLICRYLGSDAGAYIRMTGLIRISRLEKSAKNIL